MQKKQPAYLPILVYGFLVSPLEANELDPLFSLSLEELMSVEVSLTSRTEESQFNAPAAVYVITQEDIRRSGLRRLPEILRMVPGLHVAKIDANKWSVSSRNNQSRFSSAMMVMIDGRNIYTPFYAGVYWGSQDTFVDDIERIEVVRGPGGSLWGTNAVDGVINIITKSSAKTQGIKAYSSVGLGEMKYETGFRYGGSSKNGMHFRIYSKSFKTDVGEYVRANESTNNGLAPIGGNANDEGTAQQAGFRTDWTSGKNNFVLQGTIHDGAFNEDRALNAGSVIRPNKLMTEGRNLTLNWKRQINNTDSLTVISSYSQISRDDDITQNDEDTFDIDLQHNLTFGNHHTVWGLGYRYYDNDARITTPSSCSTSPCFAVDPETKYLNTWSAFIQDRITLSETVSLIIGSKFEDNDYTGFEYQPTLRGLWTPDTDTTYWSAITRAVRTPDRVSTDGVLDFGGSSFSIGNKDLESFITYTYELGYRKRLSAKTAVDNTVFYNDYRNALQGASTQGRDYIYGFEGNIKQHHTSKLSTELGYTYNAGKFELASGGSKPISRLVENTIFAKVYYQLKSNMELDTLVYYVDESKATASSPVIPAYTRVDLRYGWQANRELDVSLLLSNVFNDVHTEGYDSVKINTGTNRGIMLKLTYSTDK